MGIPIFHSWGNDFIPITVFTLVTSLALRESSLLFRVCRVRALLTARPRLSVLCSASCARSNSVIAVRNGRVFADFFFAALRTTVRG